MSALPGGAADKLGNRYEAWWTLWRMAGVLRGQASRIRLEPPGKTGAGVEFWVDEPGRRWFEQVKDAPAKGTWTVGRLTSEGVLQSLKAHLERGDHVRLVLSTTARDLSDLSVRAHAANALDEYREILTKDQAPKFEELTRTWAVPEVTAWGFLQRLDVEHRPPEQLRDFVHLAFEILVQGDPTRVVSELRSWLDDMLHQELTAPLIWDYLGKKGFRRRLLAGDVATTDALASTVDRHQTRIVRVRPTGGLVSHPHASKLVDRLSDEMGKRILIVHGRAGSGKSNVAADAVQELRATGWYAVAIRMDAVGPDTQDAAALGAAFGMSGSPALLLIGVANGSRAVLLVDQLDAVSTYSGRMQDSFDAVAELLVQVAGYPNIKVVLVARSVDLQADPRMHSLLADKSRVEGLEIGPLDPDDVQAALANIGIDGTKLSGPTRDLLRVPLHFAIFSRLDPGSRSATYRTLSDLYERYTEDLRRAVGERVGHLDWQAITATLVESMSKRERLDTPAAVLDPFDLHERDALTSAGVLIVDEGKVAFFHETYFDFLFARGFVAAGEDLHAFVAESGQYLFRRAQTRQVLEYLATTDRNAFREAASRLLASETVRPHIQEIVTTVLRQLDARAEDWRAFEPLALGNHWHSSRLASLLTEPTWFDAADAAGRLEPLLADPTTADRIAAQLVPVARQRPDRVVELLRPHIGTSDEWRWRLRAVVEWSLTPSLVNLAGDLIERGDLDDARGPIAVNSDFWTIIYGIHKQDPAGAARMIGAHLRRALARADADGSPDPFETNHLDTHSSAGGDKVIREVAAAAPEAFIKEVLPFVVTVVKHTATIPRSGELQSSPRWRYRQPSLHGIDGALFNGVERALKRYAREHPAEATSTVRPYADSDFEELRFLACRTYSAAGAGNEAIAWLLSDDRNLNLGWISNPRGASRRLIEVVSQTCDDTELDDLINRLLTYHPAWEKMARARARNGWAQYELLTAITPSRRSTMVNRRIAELERKFPGQQPASSPSSTPFGFAGPPIPEQAAPLLKDDDWRRAIKKYTGTDINWSTGSPTGGALELARLMASRAEVEPERFARLALSFDPDVPLAYLNEVIRAVAGKIPIPLLTELCAHARAVAGQAAGMTICQAADQAGADIDETLLQILEECAKDDDPIREMARTATESGQRYYGGDLLTAGLNCTRGSAAFTIARLLFARPDLADRLLPTVAALATDPILAVRAWAAEAVVALMAPQPGAALDLAAALFAAPEELFSAETTRRLLQHAIIQDPGRFGPHLERVLGGAETVAERAGEAWAIAYLHDTLQTHESTELTDLTPAARRGAAQVFAADPAAEPEMLIRLLNDKDSSVREAAAGALRNVADLESAAAQRLVKAFTSSAAFEAHSDDLFFTLNHGHDLLPRAVLPACERAIELAGKELGDIRSARSAASPDIIGLILRLYRQGDPPTRARCLDMIDALTVAGAYGLPEALADER